MSEGQMNTIALRVSVYFKDDKGPTKNGQRAACWEPCTRLSIFNAYIINIYKILMWKWESFTAKICMK